MGAAYRRILSFFLALCILAGAAGLSVLASEVAMHGEFGGEEDTADGGDEVESPNLTKPVLGGSGMVAAGPLSARTATTAEELSELLREDVGGIIRATCDLVSTDAGGGTVTKPVTVDMGPYTLFVEDFFFLDGPVHLTGRGTVVEVLNGRFDAGYGSSINAVGDNAVAVRIHEGVEWDCAFSQITTDGAGSVGIDVQAGHYVLETTFVDARGEGSVGVHSTGDLELFLCAVTAGGDTVASDSGEITLDSSNVSPVPDGATERMRTAVPWEELMEYWTLVGEPIVYFDYDHFTIYEFYLTPDDPKELWLMASIPHRWGLENVDYNTPGVYTVTTTVLPQITRRFPMIEFPPAKGTLTVLDETTIFIDYIYCVRDGAYYYTVEIELTTPLGEYDDFLLYYRRKGTSDWEMVEESHIEVIENYIFVDRLFTVQDIGTTFECQLLILGEQMVYETNIFPITIGDENGGDRHNIDRNPDVDGGDENSGGEAPVLPGGQGNGGPGGTGNGSGTSGGRRTELPDTVVFSDEEATVDSIAAVVPETDEASDPAAPVYQPDLTAQPSVQPPEQSLQREAALSYTARELADLADANPERVTFIHGGMRLLIPTPALAGIRLGEDERFLVDMGTGDNHQFYFRLFAGEQEITALDRAAFTVMLPATFAADLEGELLCRGEKGDDAPVEREEHSVAVQLRETGSYRLEQAEAAVPVSGNAPEVDAVDRGTPPPTATTGGAPIWPFLACGIPVLGGVGWFAWRRRAAGPVS